MDFGYGGTFNEESPEAYERLILDALLGDAPLFPHQREVDLSWRILDPVIERWAASGAPDGYRPGSWGPESAHQLLARDGRTWRRLMITTLTATDYRAHCLCDWSRRKASPAVHMC